MKYKRGMAFKFIIRHLQILKKSFNAILVEFIP